MAAPVEVATIPKIDWLYPELLSKEGLVEILSQRFVKLPDDIASTSKDTLLELYYHYILPRPQRQYRLNRRGREMMRKQVIQAKKRKISQKDSSEPAAKKSAENSSRLLTSFDGISLGGRLKPPPSCINSEKKVIKLGSSKSSSSTDSNSSGAGRSVSSSSSSPSSGSKIIKWNRTSSQSTQEVMSPTPSKTITLNKRVKLSNTHWSMSSAGDASIGNHNTDNSEKSDQAAEKMDTDETPSPTKTTFKINKISWP